MTETREGFLRKHLLKCRLSRIKAVTISLLLFHLPRGQNRPPGMILKKKEISGHGAHSTVDKNNKNVHSIVEKIVEKNNSQHLTEGTALSETIKYLESCK
jgi:hypothetical protein